MENPKFSVITPTYNRAHLITRAIESVLSQSFTNFELLIVDDASPDNTHDIVTAMDDPRLRYLRQAENGGVSLACNMGIENAQGDFIVFLGDDDTIEPSFLAEAYSVLASELPTVGFLWTWKNVVRQTGNDVQLLQQLTFHTTTSERHPGSKYLQAPTGGSGGLVVRASALSVVGEFDPDFRAAGDTELLIRLAEKFDYIIIPKPLYNIYVAHGERLMKPSLVRAQAYARLIELHQDLLAQYPTTLCNLYRRCAKAYYQVGNRAIGNQFMWKLIKHEPYNLKNWALFLLLENVNYLPKPIYQRTFATGRPL